MCELTAERIEEVDRIVARIVAWAPGQPCVRGIVLVGSWATGRARMDSDVDLVLVTDDPAPLVERDGWWSFAGDAEVVRTQRWGIVTERRLRLPTGLELELDVAPMEWASVPLDAATRRVLGDGSRALYDPAHLIHRAISSTRG